MFRPRWGFRRLDPAETVTVVALREAPTNEEMAGQLWAAVLTNRVMFDQTNADVWA